ncbi:transmembrane protein, putative (macronuclear) [Tetrahymena thermophila SB210]|uniref:Transmembrane protein, putative n=1 Tax=Tetrahymena thermophila (strain SB210) TaxID=312017 RepID=W7XDG8_TETTS|nr:transmembrane protein, putative [Tetrahymena thermophila SB210]EWS71866.1 transmembrane protein, putative [Tetrahymena thermophila SB210]|eukprot:XP_012655610.1 transmembrane protein, putative [Tetrahymena thermophila SB210]
MNKSLLFQCFLFSHFRFILILRYLLYIDRQCIVRFILYCFLSIQTYQFICNLFYSFFPLSQEQSLCQIFLFLFFFNQLIIYLFIFFPSYYLIFHFPLQIVFSLINFKIIQFFSSACMFDCLLAQDILTIVCQQLHIQTVFIMYTPLRLLFYNIFSITRLFFFSYLAYPFNYCIIIVIYFQILTIQIKTFQLIFRQNHILHRIDQSKNCKSLILQFDFIFLVIFTIIISCFSLQLKNLHRLIAILKKIKLRIFIIAKDT